MRIDKTQRGWALASLATLAISAFVYALYAFESTHGPRGGSAIGLAFGIIGFAFMIFAALLGARKRVRRGESAAHRPGCAAICGSGSLPYR